jgi:hypothetical protein
MSRRNIFFFENLRDAFVGQPQGAWSLGPNQRELDSLLPTGGFSKLLLGARNSNRRSFWECSTWLKHHYSIVNMPMKCLHMTIFAGLFVGIKIALQVTECPCEEY